MFSSIKWRFIVVYFLLVFIAMLIMGVFITNSMENQQLETRKFSMEQQIQTIMSTSSDIISGDWVENREGIQNTLNDWRLGSGEVLYVIYDEEIPTILSTTNKQYEDIIGTNALSFRNTDPILIGRAFEGNKDSSIIYDQTADTDFMHIAVPVYSSMGKISGILYMTSDLTNVSNTVADSRAILTNATLIALLITVVLGFFIANSITVPIRNLTKKAEEMSLGDFDQYVEIKSNDEIGQLAKMFNQLTFKLKETIEEMDLERSKLDTIFSYMAEGVIAIDKNNTIIHANPMGKKITGIDSSYIDQEAKLELEKVNMGNLNYAKPKTLDGETIFETESGVYKVKYAPFKNEKDIIAGIIMVFQDITQENKLDNMRKEFVANVSHELKTPITTIKSYTETLMLYGIESQTQKDFLSVIDKECDRMARLVRDLLQLSNIDYKKTKWVRKSVSLKDMIKDSTNKLHILAYEKNQKIECNVEENLPNINVDKDGIEQVLLNLISNAIKYTGDNGLVKISAKKILNNVVLKIEDNGMGIPQEDMSRLFERFYRVEKGRSRDMGGTGLGLSIAKEILEAHGAKIKLSSEFGKGTTVSIIFKDV